MSLRGVPNEVRELRSNPKKEIASLSLAMTILSISTLLWTTLSHSASLKFVDEVNREVFISFPPQRIVSLAPNITEILFGLGLDEEIVGVSIHCNFPEKAKSKVRVGSYISLDFEKITFLKPDLVIATGAGNTRDMVNRLGKLGFPTYVIFPKNFTDVLKSIEHLGRLVGREKEAMGIIQAMKQRSQRVIELTQGLSRPKVFLQIGEAPIVTVGKGSFADDLIHLAGGENIAGKEKGCILDWNGRDFEKVSRGDSRELNESQRRLSKGAPGMVPLEGDLCS